MQKTMLDTLFPDDPKARNRRYAAESVRDIDRDLAAGRCDDAEVESILELRHIFVGFRDAQ
jgi:hypothetical protein